MPSRAALEASTTTENKEFLIVPNFDNPARRTTAQRLDRAAPFRVDERMEALADMREQRPDEFAKIPPSQAIALGLYESDRDRHAAITGGSAA